MPLAEITVDEVYPVFGVWPQSEHWAEPENYDRIDWVEVPQEILDTYKFASEMWRRSQLAIANILKEQRRSQG